MRSRSAPSQATFSRRQWLARGSGLALTAGAWPWARAATAAETPRARSCILIYLLGGPSHIDSFDLKPEAPVEVRGPFAPIATSVPGLQICEHLPLLAQRAGQFALVRSVSYPNSNHTPMIYYTLTGRPTAQPLVDNDVRPPHREDHPHLGAAVARLLPRDLPVPGFIAIPELAVRSSTEGEFKRARQPLRGGGAGFLGTAFDPLCVNGEPGAADGVPALALPEGVAAERMEQRQELLSLLARSPGVRSAAYEQLREQAVLLTGARAAGGRLFSFDDEPAELQERYGRHRFGRALLLARRLAEAGVPFIAVHFNEMTVCDGWDTHSNNFAALQNELLPYVDQGISALLDDLGGRSLLDETLVACFGEFGRTPKINPQAGRDHWGPCSTALFAGGGIRGGAVLGASDRQAAYPIERPVDPVDLHATLLRGLGLSSEQLLVDPLGRPLPLCTGQVLHELF